MRGPWIALKARKDSSASRSMLAREPWQPPQRLQLRGEGEVARAVAVVQRLDPEAIAREHEPPPLAVPHRDREHPAQALGEARAVLLVEVDEHLGVRVRRAEHVAGRLQLGAQLGVVVDLAVLDDDDAPVLARDRLVAALEVDDRQPPRGEPGLAVDHLAAAVGPAVPERRAHGAEHVAVDGPPVGADDAADAAHISPPRAGTAATARATPSRPRSRNRAAASGPRCTRSRARASRPTSSRASGAAGRSR